MDERKMFWGTKSTTRREPDWLSINEHHVLKESNLPFHAKPTHGLE